MATNPTLLTQPIAANGAKNVIPNTTATPGAMSQDQGFPAETSLPLGAGGVAPSREDFNGAFNLLSAQNFMTQKGWIYTFDAGQAYYAGCIIRDTTDGKMYECINDVAAGGSVPSADPVNWKEFGVDTSTFADTDLSNLTATGEKKLTDTTESVVYEDGFVIIYPNNGTESNPSTIPVSTSYVEANPFAGYYVGCLAELKYNDTWWPAYGINAYSNGTVSIGFIAYQDGDTLTIKTSNEYLLFVNSGAGGTSTSVTTPLPCRIKVWKIGKVASA